MKFSIAIVDDKVEIARALADEMTASGEVEVAFTAINGADYLEKLKLLPYNQQPHAVFMDIDMPVMDGVEAVRRSAILYPDIHYIMLTIFDDDEKIFEAIRAGADGYLMKEENTHTILSALKDAIEKSGAPMSPRIARKTLSMLKQQTPAKTAVEKNVIVEDANLTSRETAILEALVDGLDNKEIGEKLFISANTVRNHIANLYSKLHINNRAQAVKLAIKGK